MAGRKARTNGSRPSGSRGWFCPPAGVPGFVEYKGVGPPLKDDYGPADDPLLFVVDHGRDLPQVARSRRNLKLLQQFLCQLIGMVFDKATRRTAITPPIYS